MRLGATLAHLGHAPPVDVARRARQLELAGFDSLWTPQVLGRGSWVADPFVTLAAAAVATTDVELGTATLQVPLHHPADLAHRVLSLRTVCGDRLSVGVSPGSTRADFEALDRDHAGRFAAFRHDVERLRVLLADGHDELADLAPAAVVASPPPLLLGSWGANVERAAREYDGWLASGLRRSPYEILAAHERYRAAGGGRAVVCAVPVTGDLDATGEVLARYAREGIDDVVVLVGPDGPQPQEVRALLPRAG